MAFLIGNWTGAIMFAIAFGIAVGLGHLVGLTAEGPMMIMAGPPCLGMDLAYRARYGGKRLFHPECGGSLFFLPVWVLGIVWMVLGSVDAEQKHL